MKLKALSMFLAETDSPDSGLLLKERPTVVDYNSDWARYVCLA